MRVKQFWDYLPLPAKLKLVWDRLTFSKLTTSYFIFSVVHCLIQLALQVRAFTINANGADFLFNISLEAKAFNNSLVPWLDGNQLFLCPDVPTALHFDTAYCSVAWNGTAVFNNVTTLAELDESWTSTSSASVPSSSSVASVPSTSSASASASTSTSTSISIPASASVTSVHDAVVKTVTKVVQVTATPTSQSTGKKDDEDDLESSQIHKRQNPDLKVMVSNSNGRPVVNISSANEPGSGAILSSNCSWSLNYPVAVLDNTKREDVTFMAFQIWVLGMSLVALLNESIPHVIASLLTHLLATGWAAFQIVNTKSFEDDFARVITHGACNGVPSLLGGYWKVRQDAEYASLALNVVALFVSGILSWKLFKSFGWQTFKRVGASLTINRIYKLVLVLSIVLQLSFFFMGATVALWIDSLLNGLGAAHGNHLTLYRVTSFVTIFLLLPWLSLGYIGVRRELRLPVILFLLMSILYLAAWSTMFLAETFRWIYLSWVFFGLMACSSVALTVLAFVLGIGLPRYLNAQEPLPGDDFTPVTYGSDPEKVDFPSNHQPIPTFSATFGKGSEVPVPTQMFPAQMGPRFFRTAQPFDSRSTSPIPAPSMAYTRSSIVSDNSLTDEGASGIMRSNTRASDTSFHSVASYYKYSDDGHERPSRSGSLSAQTMQGKRWIIE
ncbi:hypothetical protein BT96DRAFT_961456 [Gymnopus androsaceus JB14]|uniref:Uncharacterized protein n=1 Tax=Gymnopus androsaceus JB14 TaxID=1447944 RepID=A0A6A4IJL6_9AGAR|nr:hypothetical protein BT96DRAFT_961456 [Gymnopus androsaceus JB14]